MNDQINTQQDTAVVAPPVQIDPATGLPVEVKEDGEKFIQDAKNVGDETNPVLH